MIDQGFGWLTVLVVGGGVATLASVLTGVNRALRMAGWRDRDRTRAVGSVAAAMIAWLVAALVTAWLGFYQRRGIPTIQFGILVPLLTGVVLWRNWKLLRRVIDALPQRSIVGLQLFRVEGGVFLILLALGRLPGVFAWPAGVGDILVGMMAPVVAAAYMREPDATAGRLRAWNLLGLLDLVVAVTTGFLSSPSPLQQFAFDHPNQLIGAFPLVLIPIFLVPLAVLLHLISLDKLRHAKERGRESLNLHGGQTSTGPRDQTA